MIKTASQVERLAVALSKLGLGRTILGDVHVFNPQDIGGVPSTFSWSPVEGCEDPATAICRADAFAFSVSHKGVEDGSFWSSKASDYLRGYFHAAALAGYDLRALAAWVSGADPDLPQQSLAAAGAHEGWANQRLPSSPTGMDSLDTGQRGDHDGK